VNEDKRVEVSVEAGVAHVEMNRASKRNGLDTAMFDAMIEAGTALGGRNDVRAIVLSGRGPAFCAGLDFQSIMSDPKAMKHLLLREGSIANIAQRVAYVWREVEVPVIAAIHGPCFGGGLQIALGADIRFGAPDARMSVMEIEWGLIPDMSATQTLLRLLRPDVAKELTFTGRIVDAPEALSLGLLTQVLDDPLEAAKRCAQQIASRSPQAIRETKRLYDEAPFLNAKDALALETELQLKLLGTPNQLAAVQARMLRKTATFRDPE
jgi:enoyl-CoA hydratase/carnithine racemase